MSGLEERPETQRRFQAAHWADETAARVIREKGDKARYVCAAGITPSGTVHIGNFREIISVDLVVRALRDLGKETRFIYSWDDYDVFRKAPANMPNLKELERFLRFPITMIPDPWGRDESYARHHEVDVESVLPRVGINPEYLYQSQRYRASVYAQGIRKALEHRDSLRTILDKFRDEEHKIQGEWWPVSVFCESCSRDATEIEAWDGEWGLSYRCEACGNRETLDIREAKGIKLFWRIDWPMRWEYEQVDFEPAGKDHHSHGGSFDTAKLVCKEVYDWEAPVSFRYDFIGVKGGAGKMSSSSGNVTTLEEVLEVYTPEIARYLFAGTRPNTEFTISFDLDVIKTYEDYDRLERIVWGVEKAKDDEALRKAKRVYELSQIDRIPEVMPYQAPFRHLCNLIQVADGDIERTLESLEAQGEAVKLEQREAFLRRCQCAKRWVEAYAPPEFKFSLRAPGEIADFSPEEAAAARALRDQALSRIEEFGDDKAFGNELYRIAEVLGMDSKALFRVAYQALIGKDQGPRLASFLRSIDKTRLLGIFSAY